MAIVRVTGRQRWKRRALERRREMNGSVMDLIMARYSIIKEGHIIFCILCLLGQDAKKKKKEKKERKGTCRNSGISI